MCINITTLQYSQICSLLLCAAKTLSMVAKPRLKDALTEARPEREASYDSRLSDMPFYPLCSRQSPSRCFLSVFVREFTCIYTHGNGRVIAASAELKLSRDIPGLLLESVSRSCNHACACMSARVSSGIMYKYGTSP